MNPSENVENETAEIPPESHDKKYVGKFDTPDDLAKGYKELEEAFSSKQNMETQFNELTDKTKVPEEYQATGDLMDQDKEFLREAAVEAKELNLNQSQFEAFANKKLQGRAQTQEKEKEKPKIEETLKTYLQNEIGLSEEAIKYLPEADLQHFTDLRNKTLNTNTGVSSSSHGIVTKEMEDQAYQAVRDADMRGDMYAKEKALDRWLGMVQKDGKV